MSGNSKGNGRPGDRRVFIALDPPDEVCAETEVWARQIARGRDGLRVVPARNSHITLAFLGARDEFEIEEATNAIADALSPAEGSGNVGGLSLGAPAWLPKKRPRNLVVDIHDDRGDLKRLQARLSGHLNESLDWKEERPYRPHLTCARTGRGFNPAGLLLPISPAITFEGVSVTLYLSHLSPEGAEYEALASFPTLPGRFDSQ